MPDALVEMERGKRFCVHAVQQTAFKLGLRLFEQGTNVLSRVAYEVE